jgi:hypothetical protein
MCAGSTMHVVHASVVRPGPPRYADTARVGHVVHPKCLLDSTRQLPLVREVATMMRLASAAAWDNDGLTGERLSHARSDLVGQEVMAAACGLLALLFGFGGLEQLTIRSR